MKDYRLSDAIFSKASSKKIPISGTFELTADCNFNCKMCYVHSCTRKTGNYMPFEKWKAIIDEASSNGLLYALVTGGEPLTHPQFKEIYSYLYSKGLIIILNTNGYLLDRYFDFFKEKPPVRINVTLYGDSDSTYKELCGVSDGFTKVSANIKHFKENKFNINLNMTFVKSNISDAKNMLKFASENNIQIRPTTYVFPSCDGATNERLDPESAAKAALEIYRQAHTAEEFNNHVRVLSNSILNYNFNSAEKTMCGTSCRAGNSAYWIHYDGKMTFCGMVGMENAKSVSDEGFDEVWKNTVHYASCVMLPEKCQQCRFRAVCKSCYAMLESENVDDTNIKDSYTCRYYTAYADEILRIYREGEFNELL